MCCHRKQTKEDYVKSLWLCFSFFSNTRKKLKAETYQSVSHWQSQSSRRTPHRLKTLSWLKQESGRREAGGGGGEGGGDGGEGGGEFGIGGIGGIGGGGDGGGGRGEHVSSISREAFPTQNPALSHTTCDCHVCASALRFQTVSTRPSFTWIVVRAWKYE